MAAKEAREEAAREREAYLEQHPEEREQLEQERQASPEKVPDLDEE